MQIDVLRQNKPPKDRYNLWIDPDDVLRQHNGDSWVPVVEAGNTDLSNYYTKDEVNNYVEDAVLDIVLKFEGGELNIDNWE